MAQVPEDPIPPVAPAPPAYVPVSPYAPSSYGPPAPRTNVLAIVSLILSCAGLFFWLLLPIGGIITGHIALGQIKRTGEGGRPLAMAGVIVGYVLAGLAIIGIVLYVIFIIFVIGIAGTSGNFNPSDFG